MFLLLQASIMTKVQLLICLLQLPNNKFLFYIVAQPDWSRWQVVANALYDATLSPVHQSSALTHIGRNSRQCVRISAIAQIGRHFVRSRWLSCDRHHPRRPCRVGADRLSGRSVPAHSAGSVRVPCKGHASTCSVFYSHGCIFAIIYIEQCVRYIVRRWLR